MASHNYHRFEAHCYDTASSFQTVWHPLTKDTSSKPMRNITTRHVYFLTKILQDSLLTQRLNQSIMAMMGLSGRCEKIIELFCLAGLEIFKNIPNNPMLVQQFYKNMFLACSDHQVEILLNFALYLVLQQHDVVEALELLKSKSHQPQFILSLMHKAYIGLFEYLLSQPTKNQSMENQGCDDIMDIYDTDDEQDNIFVNKSFHAKTNLDFSLKRSLVLFEEVFRKPGVWDQFVPVYVSLLERSGKDLVKSFLTEYRDKNPLNPNSHRYLYHFLKTNSASDREKTEVLQALIKLDPTSEYLEDLVELHAQSGHRATIVRMLFEKLDHSGCMFDERTWKKLDLYTNTSGGDKPEPDMEHELNSCWKERLRWWPKYHFRLGRNITFSDELKTVFLCKARVAKYFLGENAFSKEVEGKYGITKNESAATNPLKRRMDNNDEEFCAKKKRCVK